MGFFIMITSSQARLIINNHIKAFTGIDQSKIEWANQTKFTPPLKGDWCRVTVQYANTEEAGLYKGLLQRDYGIINIQCFTPKGYGDLSVTQLADAWRAHWMGVVDSFFEVTLCHAPTDVRSEVESQYAMSLVRVDFRVN